MPLTRAIPERIRGGYDDALNSATQIDVNFTRYNVHHNWASISAINSFSIVTFTPFITILITAEKQQKDHLMNCQQPCNSNRFMKNKLRLTYVLTMEAHS